MTEIEKAINLIPIDKLFRSLRHADLVELLTSTWTGLQLSELEKKKRLWSMAQTKELTPGRRRPGRPPLEVTND